MFKLMSWLVLIRQSEDTSSQNATDPQRLFPTSAFPQPQAPDTAPATKELSNLSPPSLSDSPNCRITNVVSLDQLPTLPQSSSANPSPPRTNPESTKLPIPGAWPDSLHSREPGIMIRAPAVGGSHVIIPIGPPNPEYIYNTTSFRPFQCTSYPDLGYIPLFPMQSTSYSFSDCMPAPLFSPPKKNFPFAS